MTKFLLALILLITCSCTHRIYTVKLDTQLYTMPVSYGQKLVGLIYYEKSTWFSSFESEDLFKKEIQPATRKIGGNKIIPITLINESSSVYDQAHNKVKDLLIKGLIVDDISE